MAELVTLNQLKARLGIPEIDHQRDDSLKGALGAAQAAVVERTRFDETGGTRVSICQHIRLTRPFNLPFRPVTSITSVSARRYGQTENTTLVHDLIDANDGKLVLIGVVEPIWPYPAYYGQVYRQPYWKRQLEPIWEIVQVTYETEQLTADNADPRLADAIINLAAFWHHRGAANALNNASADGAQEGYSAMPFPPWVTSQLLGLGAVEGATWV